LYRSAQPEKYRQGDKPSEVVYPNRHYRQGEISFFAAKKRKMKCSPITRISHEGPSRRIEHRFNSPEVAIGKGVAGALLEIAFEGLGFDPVREVDGDDEFPRRKFVGMSRLTGVVLAQTFGQVASQANVSLVRVGLGAKEVDVYGVVTLC